MRFRPEFVDGKIVDSHETGSAVHKELRSIRLEVDELLEELAVAPVPGILRLQQNTLGTAPVESFQFSTTDRPDQWNFHNRGRPGKDVDGEIAETFSAIDHVIRRIHMSSRVGS